MSRVFATTARLVLRELVHEDEAGMFAMDSDPEVHRFLGNEPLTSIAQVRPIIERVRRQYEEHGIGRWAVEERATGEFVGWAGLKRMTETVNGHHDFHDIGYRLQRRAWGKGYATEASLAARDYAFRELGLEHLYAMAQVDNRASRAVLEKIGLRHDGDFDYAPWGLHAWYVLAAPVQRVP